MGGKALEGQTAIVTGGARRIGRAIALALAEAGANLVVNYRTSEAAARTTAEEIRSYGVDVVLVQADVAQPSEAKRLVEAARDKFGRVDILVNNAGIFERTLMEDITPEIWDRFMNINLKAQFFTTQAAAPLMRARKRGKVVNISSVGGLAAWAKFIPYCVSKAGVIHLTRCLARALAPEIQVNCVCPGSIYFPGEPPDESYIRKTPLKRQGEPKDISQAVLYLVSGADFVTGQTLVVDGGYTLA